MGQVWPQVGNDRNAQRDRKSRGKYECFHGGEVMVGSNACYGCGIVVHIIRDCPHMKNQDKANTQPQPNPTAVAERLKKNMCYTLQGREEQFKSADVVTSTFHVLSFPMYALLNPGSTIAFVTLLVASKFDLLPEILHEPFLVSTPIGDNIRA